MESAARVPDNAAGNDAISAVALRLRVQELEQEIVQLRHDAYRDQLTGLPNRTLLLERLNQAALLATRQNRTVGLLLINLDDFKGINDQLGHRTGDLLLRLFSARLRDSIRSSDTACRSGGDEFVVLLREIDATRQAQHMRAVVRKIRARLSLPYLLAEQWVNVGVSIGAAVLKDGDLQGSELIEAADAAMYLEKLRGAGRMRRPLQAAQCQPAAVF